MTHHTLTHDAVPHPAVRRHVAQGAVPAIRSGAHGDNPAARFLRFVIDRFLLLPLGAVVALVWANSAGESYFKFAHSLSFAVNEIGMAFFLALVAQEAFEAVMPGGALHTWRRWSMPLVAAVGGVAGTAAVYLGYVYTHYETILAPAWPVACAIDVAAGYYVLKTIFHRSAVLPFLIVAALATDAFGLGVVALRQPVFVPRPGGALLLLAAVCAAAVMRTARVRGFWPYLFVAGPMAWWGLYLEGIHPALALIPIVPFLPREPRGIELMADTRDDDAVHHFEHEWNEVVQVILFFFGLVNAGVLLTQYDTGSVAVLLAALAGRPVGMLLAVGLAVGVGLHLPKHIGWREVVVMALAASSGFTFALFFATGLLSIGPTLAQIKLGALATVAAAPVAIGTAWLLRVGRFASR